jgi:Xaa-Pro aminopeptidase
MQDAVTEQDQAHIEVFGNASPGDTEKELHARMIEYMIREGAEWAHGMLQSNNQMIKYGGEGPIPITSGDLVKTDYVSYHRGYAANLSRMFVMGRPSNAQRETYAELFSIHQELIQGTMHPGVEAQTVWMTLRDKFQEHGYYSVGGLAGHSTGVWWHQEEPIFRPGETTTLTPGMVVCLEPILDGYWHLQDQILITEDGPEILSDTFNRGELFVMGT